MINRLCFPSDRFTVQTFQVDGQAFSIRAWEDLFYCTHPTDDVQRLNLYAPECYFQQDALNGYTAKSAPIFMPNLVGGYMPGRPGKPELHENGQPNTILAALRHGYVVACPGIRGRTSQVGKAPALIADLKAVVRYLRHHRDLIPGNTERIITSGTSAGGALSALAGASGNQPAYQPYLAAIGAADGRDDIFAANCYCPIVNLENADPAYEWQFCDETYYRGWAGEGYLDQQQQLLARQLKPLFPAYLNSLGLTDENGQPLVLNDDGTGSFLNHVCSWVIQSAQHELDTHGCAVDQEPYLQIENGKVTGIDWPAYVHAITRMKTPPAFDALDLSSPENDEFGDESGCCCHFTAFGLAHSQKGGAMADAEQIRLINPMRQLGEGTAKHWRIRHGTHDRDTSLAIPVMLATVLRMHGCHVDFHLPWGVPHSGDYDLPQLFQWIDGLCK